MRSGPGEARTILLLHIISVSPCKQPLINSVPNGELNPLRPDGVCPFAAARLWRGRLLTTGRLSCLHPIVVCAGRVVKVTVAGVLRTRRGHLRAGSQQCKSLVEMGTVRCCHGPL